MYKKVYVPDEEVKFDYLSEPLNFNKMPKPFTEISMEEYFKQLNTWHFTYDGFFQIKNDEAKSIVGNDILTEVFCSFNEDAGYARVVDPATNRIRFFRLGCQHDYELVDEDFCSYTYKCKKCGNVITMPNGR